MEIVVCMKRVPETGEAEITVDSTERDIVRDRLTYDINESDNYALEEAVLLKEKFAVLLSVSVRSCCCMAGGSTISEPGFRRGSCSSVDQDPETGNEKAQLAGRNLSSFNPALTLCRVLLIPLPVFSLRPWNSLSIFR